MIGSSPNIAQVFSSIKKNFAKVSGIWFTNLSLREKTTIEKKPACCQPGFFIADLINFRYKAASRRQYK